MKPVQRRPSRSCVNLSGHRVPQRALVQIPVASPLAYWEAWVYLAILLIPMFFVSLGIMRTRRTCWVWSAARWLKPAYSLSPAQPALALTTRKSRPAGAFRRFPAG